MKNWNKMESLIYNVGKVKWVTLAASNGNGIYDWRMYQAQQQVVSLLSLSENKFCWMERMIIYTYLKLQKENIMAFELARVFKPMFPKLGDESFQIESGCPISIPTTRSDYN